MAQREIPKKGLNISLPTEAQWERAARGTDERIYPWGNKKIHLNLANYKSGTAEDLRTTSPVGCYPSGGTPAGLLDVVGNVWEWCLDNSEWNDKKGSNRVMRGGSWIFTAVYCRAAFRYADPPGLRYHILGFRLVLSGQK